MIGLTPNQSKLLAFIKSDTAEKGVCPSYAEMASHFGYKSKSQIFELINQLEQRGVVRRHSRRGMQRSLELIDQNAEACPHCGHPVGSDACRRAAASPVKSYSHSPAASRIAGGSPGGAQAPQPNATGGNNSDLPVP